MLTLNRFLNAHIRAMQTYAEQARILEQEKKELIRSYKFSLFSKKQKWENIKTFLKDKQIPFSAGILYQTQNANQAFERLARFPSAATLSGVLNKLHPLINAFDANTQAQYAANFDVPFYEYYSTELSLIERMNVVISPLIIANSGLPSGNILRKMKSSIAKVMIVILLYTGIAAIETNYANAEMDSQSISIVEINNEGITSINENVNIPKPPPGYKIEKVVDGIATAYTPTMDGLMTGNSNYSDGKTSTGKNAFKLNGIAVDPKLIPYGSLVYIPEVGFRIADDTGGRLKKHGKKGIFHVDIRMSNIQLAKDWGNKKVKLIIFSKV